MADTEIISSDAPAVKRVSRFFGQYVIKHRFQFKFSFIIFIFLGVASLVMWMEGNFVVNRLIQSGDIEKETAIQSLKLLNKMVANTGFLALAITFGLTVFFSHFIAGPIYRFEKVLEEMKKGNLDIFVRLRKHDEFKETAELFNQALSSLRHRLQKDNESLNVSLERIKEVAAKLHEAGKTTEAGNLEHLITEIKNNPPQVKI